MARSKLTIVIRDNKDFDGYNVCLMLGGTRLGEVKVVASRVSAARSKVVFYETHSFLDDDYRGKGYGVMLYAAAIRHGLKEGMTVTSSLVPSLSAQRVWKSRRLSRMFNVVRIGKRWWVQKELREVA